MELWHRIYTHSPDASGAHFERVDRDAADVLPPEALRELDDLLRKLQPEEDERAFAMRRFASDRDAFACLVVAERGAKDLDDRKGLRTHARVVRVEGAFDPLPLLQEWSGGLQPAGDLVEHVLVASLAKLGTRDGTVVRTSTDLVQLAQAWAAMPSGLQRRSSWAFNAADGAPVDVIWSGSGEDPARLASPKLANCVQTYVRLLRDGYAVAQDDAVRTVEDLQRVVERMTTTNRKKTRDPVDPTDANAIAELDRQYQAMYTSLQKYVDKRLQAFDARPAAASTAQPAGRRLMWMTAAIIISSMIVGGALVLALQRYWPFGTTTTATTASIAEEPQQPAEIIEPQPTTTAKAVTFASTLIRQAEQDGKWAEALAALNEQQPLVLAELVDKAVSAQGTTKAARTQLAEFSTRLKGKGAALGVQDRNTLRPLLFEYVVNERVDGKLTDIDPALLRQARDQWKLRTKIDDVNARDLHAELILRWIEANAS